MLNCHTRYCFALLSVMAWIIASTGLAKADAPQFTIGLVGDCGYTTKSVPFSQSNTCTRSAQNGTTTLQTNASVDRLTTGSSIQHTQVGTFAFVGEVFTNVFDLWQIGGVASGTPVELSFHLTWKGNYAYSKISGFDTAIVTQMGLNIASTSVIDDIESFSAERNSTSGAGTLSYSAAGTYLAEAGTPVTFNWLFANFTDPSSGTMSILSDFLDPARLTITATDPDTGKLLPVTITGADGFMYSVNTTATPEPSSLLLLSSGFGLVPLTRHWRRRCKS